MIIPCQQESFEFIKIADLDCWQRMRLAEIRVEEERQRRLKQELIITRQEDLRELKVMLSYTYIPDNPSASHNTHAKLIST